MSASSLALALPTAHPRGRLGTRRGPVASLRASAADHPDPSRRPDAPSIDRDPSTSSSSSSSSSRRLVTLGGLAAATLALAPPPASRADESGPFCDFTQTLPCDEYPQYARAPSGLLYQDLRFGEGPPVTPGKRVVVDWDGYTFYLSHVVQARNLPKGGDFAENDEAFLRFVPGDGTVIALVRLFATCGVGVSDDSSSDRTSSRTRACSRAVGGDSTRAWVPCPPV